MVAVTGLGSLPGTDFVAAARRVFEDCPELPYVPELPARGPWATMIGRSAGLLSGLAASLEAGQWRLSATPGVDHRRARATLRDDCERFAEVAEGFAGRVRVSVAGPLTLAAAVFRPLGGRVLADRGARRDVAQSVAEGVGELVGTLTGLVPAARWGVQVDEPGLPAVLAGTVPTEGGYFRHRAVALADAVESLQTVTAPLRGRDVATLIHCCAPGLPVTPLLGAGPDRAGFDAVSVDADQLDRPSWDAVAGAVDAGHELYLGVVPTGTRPAPDELAARTLARLQPLELGDALADRLVLTPACGLAGVAADVPTGLFATLRRIAARLEDDLRRG